MLLFSDVVYMLVRYASPSGVVVFAFFAAWTCVVVSVILVVCGLSVFLYMCLFVFCVLCVTVLVSCFLNMCVICVGEVNVFSLKVMVLFWGCVDFVLANSVYGLLLSMCVVFVITVCV